MKTWNVRVSVVELIEADSARAAELELRRRLTIKGFEPYEDDHFPTFESEIS